jgi:hypothetical protein
MNVNETGGAFGMYGGDICIECFEGKAKGKRRLGRSRLKNKDSNEMNFPELGWRFRLD